MEKKKGFMKKILDKLDKDLEQKAKKKTCCCCDGEPKEDNKCCK